MGRLRGDKAGRGQGYNSNVCRRTGHVFNDEFSARNRVFQQAMAAQLRVSV